MTQRPTSPRAPAHWLLPSLLLLLAIALGACSRETPEARLRQAVGALGEAIEARDAGAIEDWLAEDFIGPDAMDRDAARRMAALMFLRYRDIGVTLGPARTEMSGSHATVRFEALLTGGGGRLLPDSARAYQVESGWRLEDGEWRLTSVDWSGNR
ncbi:DUF4440 domain-containing protein [Marilutibacter spongiae]|uniref:Nuclear transport factor 2 family protein n=1 Tax=Marilutibacter spongiae TaxID=2025720 RepID=A0A7W3Y4U9_9GAMM|nr:nuclear transport factor 2 family protein [Lysobacter spongiae]MBB1059310.1 nuclear transport factor 2 family protein [Lysobacter spongiae]